MPADMPPSTGRLTPVMLDARSDARNSAALAQSSGSIGRPIGCSDDIDSRIRAAAGPSGSMPAKRLGIPPGQHEVTPKLGRLSRRETGGPYGILSGGPGMVKKRLIQIITH